MASRTNDGVGVPDTPGTSNEHVSAGATPPDLAASLQQLDAKWNAAFMEVKESLFQLTKNKRGKKRRISSESSEPESSEDDFSVAQWSEDHSHRARTKAREERNFPEGKGKGSLNPRGSGKHVPAKVVSKGKARPSEEGDVYSGTCTPRADARRKGTKVTKLPRPEGARTHKGNGSTPREDDEI